MFTATVKQAKLNEIHVITPTVHVIAKRGNQSVASLLQMMSKGNAKSAKNDLKE